MSPLVSREVTREVTREVSKTATAFGCGTDSSDDIDRFLSGREESAWSVARRQCSQDVERQRMLMALVSEAESQLCGSTQHRTPSTPRIPRSDQLGVDIVSAPVDGTKPASRQSGTTLGLASPVVVSDEFTSLINACDTTLALCSEGAMDSESTLSTTHPILEATDLSISSGHQASSLCGQDFEGLLAALVESPRVGQTTSAALDVGSMRRQVAPQEAEALLEMLVAGSLLTHDAKPADSSASASSLSEVRRDRLVRDPVARRDLAARFVSDIFTLYDGNLDLKQQVSRLESELAKLRTQILIKDMGEPWTSEALKSQTDDWRNHVVSPPPEGDFYSPRSNADSAAPANVARSILGSPRRTIAPLSRYTSS